MMAADHAKLKQVLPLSLLLGVSVRVRIRIRARVRARVKVRKRVRMRVRVRVRARARVRVSCCRSSGGGCPSAADPAPAAAAAAAAASSSGPGSGGRAVCGCRMRVPAPPTLATVAWVRVRVRARARVRARVRGRVRGRARVRVRVRARARARERALLRLVVGEVQDGHEQATHAVRPGGETQTARPDLLERHAQLDGAARRRQPRRLGGLGELDVLLLRPEVVAVGLGLEELVLRLGELGGVEILGQWRRLVRPATQERRPWTVAVGALLQHAERQLHVPWEGGAPLGRLARERGAAAVAVIRQCGVERHLE